MQIRIEDLREHVRAARAGGGFGARGALAAIARPRLSTTDGHEEVAAEVRWRFEQIGYEATELPFRFAPWAGRYALTVTAAAYLAGVLAGTILLLSARPAAAAFVLVITGAIAALCALGFTQVMHRAAWGQRRGTNLFFRSRHERPRYIIMAHLDSKSQLVPLVLRAPAAIVAGVCWILLLTVSMLSIIRPLAGAAVFVIGITAVLAGTVLVLCWADNESPGALDNASGVATMLGIAERERVAGDVAFLVTDAEELGLAGARAVAPHLPPVHGVINIDGVDDEGRFFVMERFGWPRRGLAPHLAASLLRAADALGMPVLRRDVPLGLLLDHMPLVRRGIPALTLMRGELRSMARVHLRTDDLAHIRGAGIPLAVDLVCAALDILRTEQPTPA